MEPIIERKSLVRNEVLVRRNALPNEERELKSILVCERLHDHLADTLVNTADTAKLETPFPLRGRTIAVYSSMQSEVSLDSFVRKAYLEGARIYFPCMTKVEFSDDLAPCKTSPSYMIFREIPEAYYLEFSKGNVEAIPFMAHPMKSYFLSDPLLSMFPVLDPQTIDIVVVPLVAFDSELNRLGYGGGNYDEFLAELPDHTCVVGVAFAEQEVEEVPTEPHDKKLPHIVQA